MSRRGGTRNDRGVGIVEVVIAMAMMMVAIGALYRSLRAAQETATAIAEMNQQQSDSRRVVDVLVNELRASWTGNDTYGRIDSSFAQCGIKFYSPTRDVVPKMRLITYTVSGTVLTRQETLGTAAAITNQTVWSWVAGPTVVVLRGIDNVNNAATPNVGCDPTHPMFTYQDVNGAVVTPGLPTSSTDALTIKTVFLSLTVDRILGKFPEPDTFKTSVELRSK